MNFAEMPLDFFEIAETPLSFQFCLPIFGNYPNVNRIYLTVIHTKTLQLV